MKPLPPVALLAGGRATRLGAATRNLPKSLLPVAGEPFIAHQLRLLRRQNIARVVICTGHLGEQIEAFVGDGSGYGLQVEYSSDGATLQGTGGAIVQAARRLGEEFFVMYGDSYLDTAWAPIWRAFQAEAAMGLMTVYHNQGKWDQSNLHYQQGRISQYAKPPLPGMEYIDYGLSLLRAEALTLAPPSRREYLLCSQFPGRALVSPANCRLPLRWDAGYRSSM